MVGRRSSVARQSLVVGRWQSFACYHRAVAISDTTPEARAIQEQILRNMSEEHRLRIALEMTDLARDLARTRIRQEHPLWSEAQIVRELLRLAFLPDPLPAGLP